MLTSTNAIQLFAAAAAAAFVIVLELFCSIFSVIKIDSNATVYVFLFHIKAVSKQKKRWHTGHITTIVYTEAACCNLPLIPESFCYAYE